MGNLYGLDLGTGNIKIYDKQKSALLNEKNMIALGKKEEVHAIGDEAFEMFERAPENIKVVSPLKNGVIADIYSMQTLLNGLLRKMRKGSIKGADFIVAVPTDINEVEKRAFYDLISNSDARAKNVRVVDKAIADAVGSDVDVNKAKGILIVNIGADTTEISVLSLGGIVISKLIDIGGNKFDEAICSVIKKEENLMIGQKTAETLKKEIAFACEPEEVTKKAYGRNLVTGLPVSTDITSALVTESLAEHIQGIIDNIKVILERTPPELSSDIIDTGVYITGGSSQIKHLDRLMASELGLKINVMDAPSETVAKGLGIIMENKEYKSLPYSMKN